MKLVHNWTKSLCYAILPEQLQQKKIIISHKKLTFLGRTSRDFAKFLDHFEGHRLDLQQPSPLVCAIRL